MRYVKNSASTGQTLAYTQIKDGGETAIFYLNLGKAHLIEGSYNCAMRMMDRIPQKSCLIGFPKAVYNIQLRTRLKEQYRKELWDSEGYSEVVHRPGWQECAVNYLEKMGVQILLSDVMDSETFYGGN